MLTNSEKSLYHQVHPLKLATDWGTGLLALYPFWLHHWLAALLVAFLPSILVSVLLIRFTDLEKIRRSNFGKYIRLYMNNLMVVLRFGGYALMALGAWFHLLWLLVLGLLLILFAWTRGLIFPKKT